MSGLRPVAAFFIVFTAIAWIMVAISVAKTASLPGARQSYESLPAAGALAGDALRLPSANLGHLVAVHTAGTR
jgi:hypothetical protein